jgi:flagellar hook-associated protein 3 FlgL
MRVSTIGFTQSNLAALRRAAAEVQEATGRTQSGLRISKPSDDPSGASSVMTASSSLRAIEQYRRNVMSAQGRLSMEEGVLGQLSDMMARVKQVGMQEGSGTANAATRLVAKAEVDQLLGSVVQVACTRYEGEYLFGGEQSLTAPITSGTAPYTAAATTGHRVVEIAASEYVPVAHNASEVFLASGCCAALEELSVALGNNDVQGIQTALASIDGAQASMQNLLGEVGARSGRLEVALANLDALDSTLQVFRSDLRELDLEEAVTHLVSRQNAYQAALLTTSRVMSLSLADYLR